MTLGFSSEGSASIATTGISTGLIVTPSFDIADTIISQYAVSPILVRLIHDFAEYLDPSVRFDDFYDLMWNIDTAQGYGLDVWGRIVGVDRVLHVATGGYLGFAQDAQAQTFGYGVWYGGANLTSNFTLSDSTYRRLILAKALANISDGSIPSINRILMSLFSGYGNCYVRDNGDMTLTYVFGATLSPADYTIAAQSGALPKPAGVSATVEQ